MTAYGSPTTAFRRAVRAGDAQSAYTLAHEVPRLSLADAVALTLLVRDHDLGRYDRLAARLHSRAIHEAKADLDDAGLLAAALASARDDITLAAGVVALRDWLATHDFRPAIVELEAWRARRGGHGS